MDGTCLECPRKKIGAEADDQTMFTFYQEIAANPKIIRAALNLNYSISKTVEQIN